ncbi:hypothetical protein FRX31_016268, partial [Thalictrum thalictroides]
MVLSDRHVESYLMPFPKQIDDKIATRRTILLYFGPEMAHSGKGEWSVLTM